MALTQQRAFLQQILPFSHLKESLLNRLADSMNVMYLPDKKQIRFSEDNEDNFLYLLIKGKVVELQHNEVVSHIGVRGFFGDENILETSHQNSHFEVQEEAIAYTLSANLFLQAIDESAEFAEFFHLSIVDKLNRIHQAAQSATSTEVMMDLVCNAPLQKLAQLNTDATLLQATQEMMKQKTDACLVHYEDQSTGILTSTDVLRCVATGDTEALNRVGLLESLANKPIVTVHEFDYLFNALLKMTRYQIDRLAVRSDSGFVGFLHQKDLMSLFANQSGLALLKVEQANTVDELIKVGPQIDLLLTNLNRKGIKTHYIAKLVNELHRKMMKKLVEILLPASLANKVCIFVMGSEGRSEQVIRTDQDNALIYDDDLTASEQIMLETFSQQFIDTLQKMGFPPCPGNIMLSNSAWRMSRSAFTEQIQKWFAKPSEEAFMNAAIFYDAETVFGDTTWLNELKATLQVETERYANFLRHFAVSILRFKTPVGFFGGLIADSESTSGHEVLDIKKGGIFVIVHGVRCYALEAGLTQTNTHWRIKALMDLGVFEESFGIELGETLNFLNTLRLESMLHQIEQGVSVPDNKIVLSDLSHLQQDILKKSFAVVESFKKRLIHHFGLQS